MAGVIYKIVNLVTSAFYVGSSTGYVTRWTCHRHRLKRNKHHCAHLQAAWNKYGSAAFAFVVVEEVSDGRTLHEAEQKWLDEHVGQKYCYNHSKHADTPLRGLKKEEHPNYKRPKSDKHRQQISESLKEFYAEAPENHPRYGKEHSEETRRKISENRKGKGAGESHYRFGKTLSDEVRAKISAAQLGKPKAPRILTEEGREKIRASAAAGNYSHWKGKSHTEESRQKMSRRVLAISPEGEEKEYPSITAIREAFNMTAPTVTRALQSGKSISKGVREGWQFKYIS